jgi:hypothetical protein
MTVDGERHAPLALPFGNDTLSILKRLRGPHFRSGRLWKISPTLGFDPRTLQLVWMRYTVYWIPALEAFVAQRNTLCPRYNDIGLSENTFKAVDSER